MALCIGESHTTSNILHVNKENKVSTDSGTTSFMRSYYFKGNVHAIQLYTDECNKLFKFISFPLP